MRRPRAWSRRILTFAVLGLLASPALLRAAGPARPGAPRAAADWSPPTLTFPGDRITLAEAVRLTLENDPALRLQRETTRSQFGAFMTQTGRFDWTVGADASWKFTQQALTFSQTGGETKKRTDLDKDIGTASTDTAKAQAELAEANKIAADPNNYVSSSSDVAIIQFQLQVSQFNQAIAAESDPLKKAILIAQRNAAIQASLQGFQSGVLDKQANEQFLRGSRANLGDVPRISQENQGNVDLALTFPYRDGVTAGLFANGSFDQNGYKGKPKQSEFGGLGAENVYTLEIGFSLNVSLLRGRGVDATGAPEKAAGINYEASEAVLKHTASTSVVNTITAYWNLVAAQEFLDIALKTARLGDKRLEITDALISGDELPRAERARSLASQATDAAQVASAERAVNEARVTLAKAMGVSVAEPANAPLAADPFPPVPDSAALDALSPAPLIELALARRWDRQAASKLRESGGVLAVAARTALRPRLDFAGRISANSIAETSLSKTSDGWVAPGWQASLQFEAPVYNNAAKGRLLQAEADLAQRTINSTDLDRNIKANLVSLVASVKSSGRQVARLDESVRLYGETVESETERYKSGQSSLIDTIVTQDLQTNALVTWASARQQYATFVARLRFETGTLVESRGDLNVVRPEDFVTLPATSR
jgi:outer membrane protein TolC